MHCIVGFVGHFILPGFMQACFVNKSALFHGVIFDDIVHTQMSACFIFQCLVSVCLRSQANTLTPCVLICGGSEVGVCHNVALYHTALRGGCHTGECKSANVTVQGMEIALRTLLRESQPGKEPNMLRES